MALNIIQGYTPSTVEPIDSRFVRADQAARYAINAFDAYDGLVVYQSDTKQLYVLVDKTNIGNSTGWQTIQNSASASAAFPFTGSAQITGSLGLTGSMVQGSGSVASGLNSYAHGLSVTARGDYSRAEGTGATTGITGAYSASVDTNFSTFSSFTMSAAYGNITSSFTSGDDLYTYNVLNEYTQIIPVSRSYYVAPNTIIESSLGTAYSGRSFIVNFSTGITNGLGDQTIPANYSHAEGRNTLTVGDYSHAEGSATNALGYSSHAEGGRTEARGFYSHAEGYETDAYGATSHAEGYYSAATGEGSHVEGYISLAQGDYSHAEGVSCAAIGVSSHAEGSNTTAYGYASHAEGIGTQAVDEYQHVQGIYNLPVSGAGAFILGNGNENTQIQSNLIYASGSQVEITGSLRVTGSLNVTGNSSTFSVANNGQVGITSAVSNQFIINNGSSLRLNVDSNGFAIRDADGYGFGNTSSSLDINASNTTGRIKIWTQASNTMILGLGGQDTSETTARKRTTITPVADASIVFSPTVGTAIDYSFETENNSRFAPNSGNATYTQIQLRPTISSSGTYLGTVTGLLYNPNLTSTTGVTHRAIETVTGDVIFGSTSGNVGIGKSTPTARLDVSGSVLISGSLNVTSSLTVNNTLTTQGARTRKYRTVTLTDSDWSTGPTKGVQSDDDIIIITDNTTTSPVLGEANFDLSNLLSSPAGRCVEIIKIVDGTGGGIRVASNNGGSISLTLNEVLSATGKIICASVGQSVTIMSIGSSDAGYAWGNGW